MESLNVSCPFIAEMMDIYLWGQGDGGALGNGKNTDLLIPSVVKDFLYLEANFVACGLNIAGACTSVYISLL